MGTAVARGEAVLTMPDKPLLLCYDGSENAKHAIREAAALLAPRRALVLSVWQDAAAIPSLAWAGASLPDLETVMAAARDGAERMAEEGAGIARATGFDADRDRAEAKGPIWAAVEQVAEEHDASAIVVGTRGLERHQVALARQRVERDRPPLLAPHRRRRAELAAADYGRTRRRRPDDARRQRAQSEGCPRTRGGRPWRPPPGHPARPRPLSQARSTSCSARSRTSTAPASMRSMTRSPASMTPPSASVPPRTTCASASARRPTSCRGGSSTRPRRLASSSASSRSARSARPRRSRARP